MNLYAGRPSRNGTYINFIDATTNTTVLQYDCGWAPQVIYTGYTIAIYIPIPTPWIPGRSYYVLFDSGMSLLSFFACFIIYTLLFLYDNRCCKWNRVLWYVMINYNRIEEKKMIHINIYRS